MFSNVFLLMKKMFTTSCRVYVFFWISTMRRRLKQFVVIDNLRLEAQDVMKVFKGFES